MLEVKMHIILKRSLSVLLLSSLIGCYPFYEKAFKNYYDHLHGYDVCGEAEIECLRTKGWKIEQSSIDTVKDVYEKRKQKKQSLVSRKLERMLTQFQEGDEIWHFDTPPATWEELMGCEGYMLIRNQKKIDEVCIIIN